MLPFTLLYSLTVLLSDPKLGLALIRQAKCLPFMGGKGKKYPPLISFPIRCI